MPIAKSPAMAWENFNDTFIKAVLVFVVMVNVICTRKRLMAMMWLSISIGGVLSYIALGMYLRGEMNVEGYRVGGGIGGMFHNPNEMSVHLIMMFPLVVTLGLASKSAVWKIIYLAIAVLLLSANLITFSRGGFLGLLAAAAVLAWKLGRKNRFGVMLVTSFAGVLLMLLAPGGFGLRVLSIFIPGLDPVGSSDQRRELLERSIVVSLRNPWGIGIGNFPIVGVRNLVSHNAYTQVSAELGVLGLIAYLIFILSPFRKLGAIERTLFDKNEYDWFYYLSVGLQASIVAYLVSSFFASIAYNWFIYYLIAYAVAFRRVYQLEKGLSEEVKAEPFAGNLWRTKTA
jgi:O-antigen ligase